MSGTRSEYFLTADALCIEYKPFTPPPPHKWLNNRWLQNYSTELQNFQNLQIGTLRQDDGTALRFGFVSSWLRVGNAGRREGAGLNLNKVWNLVKVAAVFVGLLVGGTTVAWGQGSGAAGVAVITKQAVGGTFAKDAALRLYIQASSPDGGYLTYQWWRTQDTVPQSVAAGFGDPLTANDITAIKGNYSAV
ncbi:MAG: hypothetical protein LBR84_08295, partial [Tannerella sp.]|nr:hypothetical protein [Tannerella sp.]